MPGAPPETAALPVDVAEADRIFAPLLAFSTVVVAVSGGADSMALLHLLVAWQSQSAEAGEHGPIAIRPRIVAATVDHGLRDESASEARQVGIVAAGLGLEHHCLAWCGPKPRTGVQAAARLARYRLLAALALRYPRPAIVTAHHLDDQAETLLMRLARGSGLDGLAGMRPAVGRTIDDCGLAPAGAQAVPLLRPLLGIPKTRLVATLRAGGHAWTEDPSNANPAFERTRWRRHTGMLADLGLTPAALARTAGRLARAQDLIERTVEASWRSDVDLHAGACASLDADRFYLQPEELQLRLLARLVRAFGGRGRLPSLAQTEALLAALSSTGARRRSLAGVLVERRGAELRVFREAGRGDLPAMALQPGATAIWDQRFALRLSANISGPVTVRALGAATITRLARERATLADRGRGATFLRLPRVAAMTLPGAWIGDELIALPCLTASEALEPEPESAGKTRLDARFVWT